MKRALAVLVFLCATPELAPGRKVSEQDCSKPVDLQAGNLRCK